MSNKKASSKTATEMMLEARKDDWNFMSSPDLVINAVKRIEKGTKRKVSSISLRYGDNRVFVYISQVDFY